MAITKSGVDRGVAGKKHGDMNRTEQTAEREHTIDRFVIQNQMPDCGYAEGIDARCRSFGVLGFDTRPNAQIGGQLIRKVSEEERERAQY